MIIVYFVLKYTYSSFLIIEIRFCLPIDVNECSRNGHGCEQNCINTLGSYQCYCNEGFLLTTDNMTCTGKLYCTNNLKLLCFYGLIINYICYITFLHFLRYVKVISLFSFFGLHFKSLTN